MSAALALKATPRPRPAPAFEPLYVSAERIILLRGTLYNICLREIHDRLYGEPLPGVCVRFVLVDGSRILSRSIGLPAARTGWWPSIQGAGSRTLVIQAGGRLQGAGGAGGNAAELSAGGPGGAGGGAFLVESEFKIDGAGELWSGGGGGGAGGSGNGRGGGGGGGGSGTDPGTGGSGAVVTGGTNGSPGQPGTSETGGAGGVGGNGGGVGGAGAGPGLPGATGGTNTDGAPFRAGGAGGAAGAAIDGVSLLTFVPGHTLDVRGPQIN